MVARALESFMSMNSVRLATKSTSPPKPSSAEIVDMVSTNGNSMKKLIDVYFY
jgi:hypothetical protein